MPADAGHFTFPLAQKKGFLAEEGLEAEIITITGQVANIALASGDIDYYTGFGSAMRAMVQGSLPSRIVVCFRPSPHFVLLGRPELKAVKDLKGKTIGAVPGGAVDLVARLIIKHFGLDPDKDMKFIRSTTEGAFARMSQGLIDAQALPVPWDYRGKKLGFIVLARAEDLFTYPISGLIAHTKKIKGKPDEIKRLIRAGIKGNRYMRANRDGTIPILMTTYRLDKEGATALYDSFVKNGRNENGRNGVKGEMGQVLHLAICHPYLRLMMACPLRLEFYCAIYHLTSRDNAREDIFDEDGDREPTECPGGASLRI
jgi:ABC-type nitrate/sulfonate/bicarbonate transport system substrate-binding protein